jgi:hypothetical protein
MKEATRYKLKRDVNTNLVGYKEGEVFDTKREVDRKSLDRIAAWEFWDGKYTKEDIIEPIEEEEPFEEKHYMTCKWESGRVRYTNLSFEIRKYINVVEQLRKIVDKANEGKRWLETGLKNGIEPSRIQLNMDGKPFVYTFERISHKSKTWWEFKSEEDAEESLGKHADLWNYFLTFSE